MQQGCTVLITGGTGFLGRHVAARLERDHSVRVAARSAGVDVADAAAVTRAVDGVDAVVHLAGQLRGDPREVLATNVLGTVNVASAAAARGCPVILASSAAVYGGVDAYAESKRLAERVVAYYSRAHGLDASILRVFNVFGEGDRGGVVARFLAQDPVLVHGDGRQVRDFVHAADVAEAVALALAPSGLLVTDVGSGRGMSINEVAHMTRKRVQHVSVETSRGISESVARAVRLPGWRPRVSLREWMAAQTEQTPRSSEPSGS